MRYRLVAGLVLVSSASLMFEIALTRVYAIAQGHHFAFVAIAMALLGIGAAGTLTATSRRLAGAAPTTAIGWAGALFALTAVGAYVTADRIPLDTYRIGADASQLLWLALFFIVAAVPFTCAGIAVVAALRHRPAGAGATYGASLAGSAAGAALALPLLAQVGSAATILLAAALAAAAPVVAAPRLAAIGAGLASIALVVGATVIAPAGPRVSIHSQLAQALQRPDTRRLDTKLSANSRVDILQNAGFRTTTGLSLNYAGPVPRPRIGLTVDGGNAAALDVPVAEALDQVPLTHAIGIRPAASALLLDPIGAFDAAVLLRAGVDQVDLVQPDAALRQAWQAVGDATVLNDDRVRVLDQGVRSALRSAGSYDLVIWPLRESFQGVAAGTFGLRETYALTRNALADGWRALAPNGRLVVTRWLQATPSESVRMWASLLDALRQAGVADPAAHVLAWRSLEVATMVASPTAFTSDERQALSDRFARDGFDWVFHVKLQEADSNRFNRLPDTSLHRAFRAVVQGEPTPAPWAPIADDRPYFFHYFDWTLWREILSTTGRTWQPFGGAGFLVLVPLAAAATGAAVLTMIAPLMGRRQARGAQCGNPATRLRGGGRCGFHGNTNRPAAAPDPGSRRAHRRVCDRHRRHAGLGRPRQPVFALVATHARCGCRYSGPQRRAARRPVARGAPGPRRAPRSSRGRGCPGGHALPGPGNRHAVRHPRAGHGPVGHLLGLGRQRHRLGRRRLRGRHPDRVHRIRLDPARRGPGLRRRRPAMARYGSSSDPAPVSGTKRTSPRFVATTPSAVCSISHSV